MYYYRKYNRDWEWSRPLGFIQVSKVQSWKECSDHFAYRLRANPEAEGCPTGCAYEKDSDDFVWCFKPGAYKYNDKCYCSTSG